MLLVTNNMDRSLDTQYWLRRGIVRLSILFVLLLCFSPARALEPPVPFTVFSAASFTELMEDLSRKYEQSLQQNLVSISVAGSGTLARQIVAGAPADVFISADRQWVDYLVDKGIVEQQSATLIAKNRLVLVTKSDASLSGNLQDRLRALSNRGLIAIGEPLSVPAGRYAKAALVSLELWDELESRLVPTQSVRVALTLVARGEVEGAIVYGTDAQIVPELTIQGVFLSGLHPPIEYWAMTFASSPWTAFDFVVKLGSDEYLNIIAKHGFLLP